MFLFLSNMASLLQWRTADYNCSSVLLKWLARLRAVGFCSSAEIFRAIGKVQIMRIRERNEMGMRRVFASHARNRKRLLAVYERIRHDRNGARTVSLSRCLSVRLHGRNRIPIKRYAEEAKILFWNAWFEKPKTLWENGNVFTDQM